MAKRKINWTEKANFERKKILDYWKYKRHFLQRNFQTNQRK